jgi:hypothetical protein
VITITHLAALALLTLVFLGTVVLVVVLLLALEQRAKMAELRRDVTNGLANERACVLRDVAHGRREHEKP